MSGALAERAPAPAERSAEPSVRAAVGSPTPPTWPIRISGILLVLAACSYLPWLLRSTNPHDVWLSWPFAVANIVLIGTACLSLVNNWQRGSAPATVVATGHEHLIAVLIPTAGEPPDMVERTVRSVLTQDWPEDRLLIAVGDDADSPALRARIDAVRTDFPDAALVYYVPPPRGSAARNGQAKAGNLNAGLRELDRRGIEATLVETRDADDVVGDARFLRRCAAQFAGRPRLAYVQTIKESEVAPDDPFGNNDEMFYRGSLFSRHAANAVFPCGSGLLWSRAALDDIGGFPAWNLVEDLHSGIEALRRGWQSSFVPIVGARAQAGVEDMQNVFKQRGTWALDTVRLLVWGDLRGLRLRQRLQFLELGLFYSQSLASLVFLVAPALGLLVDRYPLITSQLAYAVHFWPMTVAFEAYLIALNSGNSWTGLFRSRQMWIGLAPLYATSFVRAIAYGPRDKPVYKVTRKSQVLRWYWRETLPHMVLIAVLSAGVVVALRRTGVLATVDLGSVYWSVVALVFLISFLPKGWFGLRPASIAAAWLGTRPPVLSVQRSARQSVRSARQSLRSARQSVRSARQSVRSVGRSVGRLARPSASRPAILTVAGSLGVLLVVLAGLLHGPLSPARTRDRTPSHRGVTGAAPSAPGHPAMGTRHGVADHRGDRSPLGSTATTSTGARHRRALLRRAPVTVLRRLGAEPTRARGRRTADGAP